MATIWCSNTNYMPEGHVSIINSNCKSTLPCSSTSIYSNITSQLIYPHAVFVIDYVTIILYLIFITYTIYIQAHNLTAVCATFALSQKECWTSKCKLKSITRLKE